MSEMMTERQAKVAKLSLPTPSNAQNGLSNAFQRRSNPGKKPLPTPFQRLPTAFLPTPLYPHGVGTAALGSLEARPAGYQHAERAPLESLLLHRTALLHRAFGEVEQWSKVSLVGIREEAFREGGCLSPVGHICTRAL
jgi:hypothetical protein